VTPKPFVKAAGGKTKLVPAIMARLPAELAGRVPRSDSDEGVPDFRGVYYEPFVGGGAVFLAIASRIPLELRKDRDPWAVLNDANADLMHAYVSVRDAGPKLEARLKEMRRSHCKEFYYKTRGEEPAEAFERAARFVYLNKTAFNGLHRVNAAGKFNVPMGDYKDPKITEPGVIAHWTAALKGVDLFSKDFEPVIAKAAAGDFLYCDPPYLPRSKTADFDGYTVGGFLVKDHERLAASLTAASARGCKFLCSQGDGETVRALYKAFEIQSVTVRHSIAAKKSSRVPVAELLISNY
jgi:DNA adenine methylase